MRHVIQLATAALLIACGMAFAQEGATAPQPTATPPPAAETAAPAEVVAPMDTPNISSALDLLLQKCMICHGKRDFKKVNPDGSIRVLFVDEEEIRNSVHTKRKCTECHGDVKEIPHRDRPKPVDCSTCHYKGNPLGAPSDMNLQYQESVHGKEVAKGNALAPVCRNCHGQHNIRRPDDEKSTVNRYNVAETCGKCHLTVFSQYRISAHGEAVLDHKNPDAPVCTQCHGEHSIVKAEDELSPVRATNVSNVCAKCHAAESIVGKYGIETEQIETYKDSFHGIAGGLGSKTVANCSSCHGVHDILAPNNPKSSVNVENIPKTCGKCHPNANANYAKGKIHINAHKKEAGILFYVGQAFNWLTIMTMVGLVAHILLDLYRRAQESKKAKAKGRSH